MVRERKKKGSSREECQNMYGSFEAKGSVTTRASYIGDKTQEEGIPDRYVRYYIIAGLF